MGVMKIYIQPLRIYKIEFIESVGYIILMVLQMVLQTINIFLTYSGSSIVDYWSVLAMFENNNKMFKKITREKLSI